MQAYAQKKKEQSNRHSNQKNSSTTRSKSFVSASLSSQTSTKVSINSQFNSKISIAPAPQLIRQPFKEIVMNNIKGRNSSNEGSLDNNDYTAQNSNVQSTQKSKEFFFPSKQDKRHSSGAIIQKSKLQLQNQSEIKIQLKNQNSTHSPLMFQTTDITPQSDKFFGQINSSDVQLGHNSYKSISSQYDRKSHLKNFSFNQLTNRSNEENEQQNVNIINNNNQDQYQRQLQSELGIMAPKPPRNFSISKPNSSSVRRKLSHQSSLPKMQYNNSFASFSNISSEVCQPQYQKVNQYENLVIQKDFLTDNAIKRIQQSGSIIMNEGEVMQNNKASMNGKVYQYRVNRNQRKTNNKMPSIYTQESNDSSLNSTQELMFEDNFVMCRCLCEPKFVTKTSITMGKSGVEQDESRDFNAFRSNCSIF